MPVSSISRSAKGAASSSAVSALAPKREYVLDLTLRKLAQSLLLLKRASGDLADPQTALRLKLKRWTGRQPLKCSIKATWFGLAQNARPSLKVAMDLSLEVSGTTGSHAAPKNLQILFHGTR
jgi:hypothetical protein